MPIDGCHHDFAALAGSILPDHMKRLQEAMHAPKAMADFGVPREGVRTLLRRHDHPADFSGCYVLVDDHPIYVGISRTVYGRLRQHVTGRTHFDASLAYRMAEAELPHSKTRNEAMEDPIFAQKFKAKRDYIRSLTVATVRIENPVELYVFEVYAAMTLDTKWNSFRTH